MSFNDLKIYYISSGCLVHTTIGYLVKKTANQITLRYPILCDEEEGSFFRLDASFLDVDNPDNDVTFQTQALSHHGYVTQDWMIEEYISNAEDWNSIRNKPPSKKDSSTSTQKVVVGRFPKKETPIESDQEEEVDSEI